MDTQLSLLAAFVVVETILVLFLGPVITQRRVKRDVAGIVATDVAPIIVAAVKAATDPLREALEAVAAEDAAEQANAASSAGQQLGNYSARARESYAMREEAFEAALISKAGPVGVIIAEEAKHRFRNHWKGFVNQGPAAVPELMKLAGKLGIKGAGTGNGGHGDGPQPL